MVNVCIIIVSVLISSAIVISLIPSIIKAMVL